MSLSWFISNKFDVGTLIDFLSRLQRIVFGGILVHFMHVVFPPTEFIIWANIPAVQSAVHWSHCVQHKMQKTLRTNGRIVSKHKTIEKEQQTKLSSFYLMAREHQNLPAGTKRIELRITKTMAFHRAYLLPLSRFAHLIVEFLVGMRARRLMFTIHRAPNTSRKGIIIISNVVDSFVCASLSETIWLHCVEVKWLFVFWSMADLFVKQHFSCSRKRIASPYQRHTNKFQWPCKYYEKHNANSKVEFGQCEGIVAEESRCSRNENVKPSTTTKHRWNAIFLHTNTIEPNGQCRWQNFEATFMIKISLDSRIPCAERNSGWAKNGQPSSSAFWCWCFVNALTAIVSWFFWIFI